MGQYLSPLARFERDKAVLFSPGTLRSKNNDKEMSTGDLDNHFHSALSWKGYQCLFLWPVPHSVKRFHLKFSFSSTRWGTQTCNALELGGTADAVAVLLPCMKNWKIFVNLLPKQIIHATCKFCTQHSWPDLQVQDMVATQVNLTSRRSWKGKVSKDLWRQKTWPCLDCKMKEV